MTDGGRRFSQPTRGRAAFQTHDWHNGTDRSLDCLHSGVEGACGTAPTATAAFGVRLEKDMCAAPGGQKRDKVEIGAAPGKGRHGQGESMQFYAGKGREKGVLGRVAQRRCRRSKTKGKWRVGLRRVERRLAKQTPASTRTPESLQEAVDRTAGTKKIEGAGRSEACCRATKRGKSER